MINIISNATPTVTITVGTENTGIYSKKVNLSFCKAEDLYIYMQLRPVDETIDAEYYNKILSYLDKIEMIPDGNNEIEIKFDDSFIRYMHEKYPNRDYGNYFCEVTSNSQAIDPYWDIEPED